METKFSVGDLIHNTKFYPESCFLVKEIWDGLSERVYSLYDVKKGELLDASCFLVDPWYDKVR